MRIGGWLVKHTGDGACAAFGSARAAIDAAAAAQRSLVLSVRMGVATGEAERRGDAYFGPVVNRTARVMAPGHGGQIPVARSTTAVLQGVEFVDLGEHRLRDLAEVEHLLQVASAGLVSAFPPLRTAVAIPLSLPLPVDRFVGRAQELAAVVAAVAWSRLVALTVVGNCSEARAAVSVAMSKSSLVARKSPRGDV
jgi:hypothetical protein